MKYVVFVCLLILSFSAFVFADTNSSSDGSFSGEGVKVFHIDDVFEIGWSYGGDNYQAEYKIWKIEEREGKNTTIFILASGGGIAFDSLNKDFQYLGAEGKMIIDRVYISGDEKWVGVRLENAEFVESVDLPEASSSSSGGGGGSSSGSDDDGSDSSGGDCGRDYVCDDGSVISKERYCGMRPVEVPVHCENNVCSSGSTTMHCLCDDNPKDLCPRSSSVDSQGSDDGAVIGNSSSNGSLGSDSGMISCDGCFMGDSCLDVGYRFNGTFCDVDSNFSDQLNAEVACNNNFECSTNLCIDGECISSGVWRKFVRWISRIFE